MKDLKRKAEEISRTYRQKWLGKYKATLTAQLFCKFAESVETELKKLEVTSKTLEDFKINFLGYAKLHRHRNPFSRGLVA